MIYINQVVTFMDFVKENIREGRNLSISISVYRQRLVKGETLY